MDRVQLVKFIRDKFSDSELRDLCFELHIDYESLPGEGKAAKARELVSFCERRDRLPELERTARHMLETAELTTHDDSLATSASNSPQTDGPSNIPIDDRARETASLQQQLAEARENLRVIEEHKAKYVQETDVPLQYLKEESRWRATIAELEDKLRDR